MTPSLILKPEPKFFTFVETSASLSNVSDFFIAKEYSGVIPMDNHLTTQYSALMATSISIAYPLSALGLSVPIYFSLPFNTTELKPICGVSLKRSPSSTPYPTLPPIFKDL